MNINEKVDRSNWSKGPWDNEPEDRIEWRDKVTGLPCLMVRGGVGAWCGYVAVPPDHPWHGVSYDDINADAHGGLTYSGACRGHICHAPEPGESDNVWWVGFDTAHYGDRWPSYGGSRGTYRDKAYVRNEVTQLAAQAKEAVK